MTVDNDFIGGESAYTHYIGSSVSTIPLDLTEIKFDGEAGICNGEVKEIKVNKSSGHYKHVSLEACDGTIDEQGPGSYN